jgi:hypothetical protein
MLQPRANLSGMKILRLLFLLCLGAGLALAQDAKPAASDKYGPTVEITAEPSHHLKIDNPTSALSMSRWRRISQP